jgi:hypothetical protein
MQQASGFHLDQLGDDGICSTRLATAINYARLFVDSLLH